MAQIDWVLDYLDDIESDLSAFHRVDDWRALSGARYFMLAPRLAGYPGVMQARAIALKRDEDEGRAPGQGPRAAGEPQAVEVSDTLLLAQLANEGWVEHERDEG